MHSMANCQTIAIMHRHWDAQVSIDRVLYTEDSECTNRKKPTLFIIPNHANGRHRSKTVSERVSLHMRRNSGRNVCTRSTSMQNQTRPHSPCSRSTVGKRSQKAWQFPLSSSLLLERIGDVPLTSNPRKMSLSDYIHGAQSTFMLWLS